MGPTTQSESRGNGIFGAVLCPEGWNIPFCYGVGASWQVALLLEGRGVATKDLSVCLLAPGSMDGEEMWFWWARVGQLSICSQVLLQRLSHAGSSM